MVKFEKRKPSEEEIEKMKNWPTWESPMPPGFDWEYTGGETNLPGKRSGAFVSEPQRDTKGTKRLFKNSFPLCPLW